MTRFVSLQTNFSSGEMDPLLLARVDLAAYQNALSEATNVVIQPQGGLRRRAGLRYLSALPNAGAESAANGVRYTAPTGLHDDCVMALALAVDCKSHNRPGTFYFA